MAQVTSHEGRIIRGDSGGQRFVSVDSAANDSDKTLTVPVGQFWVIQTLFVTFATSADVGNRQIVVVVSDGTNTLGIFNADSTQAGSTTEYYTFSPNYGSATETPATFHYAPLPVYSLDAGSTIRVYDSATVAAAADDMTLVLYGHTY